MIRMDKKKISTLLSNIIAEDMVKAAADGYMGLPNPLKGSLAGRGAKRATGRLPVREAWREAEPKEKDSWREAYQNVTGAMTKCGKVLEEDDFKGTVTGVVYAGIKDMNPAVLVVEVEQENLRITAYAKEGILNQHTAEEAIDKFVKAL